jgi:predicted RNA-binding protein with PUA-like domain
MAYWLVKEEPTHYSFADLERDGATEWDGVHHPLALRHLKAMRLGDEVLVYHTGTERAIRGIAQVTGAPHPDPSDDRGSWSVPIRPLRPLRRAVTLAELKGDRSFAGFDLLRLGRLTVMPVPRPLWARLLKRAETVEDPGPMARRAARAR